MLIGSAHMTYLAKACSDQSVFSSFPKDRSPLTHLVLCKVTEVEPFCPEFRYLEQKSFHTTCLKVIQMTFVIEDKDSSRHVALRLGTSKMEGNRNWWKRWWMLMSLKVLWLQRMWVVVESSSLPPTDCHHNPFKQCFIIFTFSITHSGFCSVFLQSTSIPLGNRLQWTRFIVSDLQVMLMENSLCFGISC